MLYPSRVTSEPQTVLFNLVSVIPITAALKHLAILRNSSILARRLLISRCMRWSPFLLKASNFGSSIWCLVTDPRFKLTSSNNVTCGSPMIYRVDGLISLDWSVFCLLRSSLHISVLCKCFCFPSRVLVFCFVVRGNLDYVWFAKILVNIFNLSWRFVDRRLTGHSKWLRVSLLLIIRGSTSNNISPTMYKFSYDRSL